MVRLTGLPQSPFTAGPMHSLASPAEQSLTSPVQLMSQSLSSPAAQSQQPLSLSSPVVPQPSDQPPPWAPRYNSVIMAGGDVVQVCVFSIVSYCLFYITVFLMSFVLIQFNRCLSCLCAAACRPNSTYTCFSCWRTNLQPGLWQISISVKIYIQPVCNLSVTVKTCLKFVWSSNHSTQPDHSTRRMSRSRVLYVSERTSAELLQIMFCNKMEIIYEERFTVV